MRRVGGKFDRLTAVTPSLPPDSGRIVARLARSMETALGDADLSPSQYRVLAFLSEDGANAAATALAGRMAVSKPSITALVDGLVQRGSSSADPTRTIAAASTTSSPPRVSTRSDRADTAVNARLGQLVSLLEPAGRDLAGPGLAEWGEALVRLRSARLASEPTG